MIASGEGSFVKTSDMLKHVREFLFPEIAEDTSKKSEEVKKLIEQEVAKGEIKIQRLDYGRKKGKKRQ